GAVMGSKNLKAIAVARGKGGVKVHDREKLSATSKEMFEVIKSDPGWSKIYHWGTLWIMGRNAPTSRVPFKNYTTAVCPMTEEQIQTFSPEFLRERNVIKPHPCWACQMHHCHIIRIPDGTYAGMEGDEPEYEGYAAVGTQLGIWDSIAATALCNEVDRLGLNILEAGWVLGMAIECYEKGLLTKQDTDGLEMTWGNVAAVRAMIQKIAHRQGLGNILAEGTMRAAQQIGGEATQFAIHSMSGSTPRSHDHRVVWPYILDICTSNTGTSEANVTVSPRRLGLSDPPALFAHHKEVASLVAKIKGASPFIDSLGVCRFTNSEVPDLLVGMLNAATGWDFTWEEALRVGLRSVNLLRSFNIRHGYNTALEAPSPRYGSTPTDGLAKGIGIIPVWDEMLDIYYREMGWDRTTGKPLPETLRKLDLSAIIPDLWPEKGD
ncbi:aldehyde ferredoxin oxidoreductase C-terminal domain-containing protein, partial [Chloroflexota bacterium]